MPRAKRAGVRHRLTGGCQTSDLAFAKTVWVLRTRGFPTMMGKDAFLMKDVVLFAVSVYLLKHYVLRALPDVAQRDQPREIGDRGAGEMLSVTVTT